MGPGIAATLLRGGMDVRAYDVSAQARQEAPNRVTAAISILDALNTPDKRDGRDVTIVGDLETCLQGADLVIESIPEDLDLKLTLLDEVDRRVSASPGTTRRSA